METRPSKRRMQRIVLWTLILLPVLYVLSIGPGFALLVSKRIPGWCGHIWAPIATVADHLGLSDLLWFYIMLWAWLSPL